MKKTIFALAAGLALIGGTAAQAQPEIDFTVPALNPGASITYAGGAAPLVGTAITITQLQGLNTPSNSGAILTVTGGTLGFTSGNLTSSTASSWVFGVGPASAVTINGSTAHGSGALLSGQVESVIVTASGANNFNVAIGVILNIVNPTLASFFGLSGGSSNPWTGNFNIGFTAAATPPGAISSTQVLSGDLITTPVPEPSTMAIAGLGALGMIGYGLRRRKALGA